MGSVRIHKPEPTAFDLQNQRAPEEHSRAPIARGTKDDRICDPFMACLIANHCHSNEAPAIALRGRHGLDHTFSDLFGEHLLPFHFHARPIKHRRLESSGRAVLKESKHGYLLQAEVPGVVPDDVNVRVDEGYLHVKGPNELALSVHLPDGVEVESIKACLLHGVLKISIPKIPPSVVEVTSEDIRGGDRTYIIKVNVPGFGPEDISVELSNRLLVLRGQKEERKLEREFSLPEEADLKTLQVAVRDGIAKVVVNERTTVSSTIPVATSLEDIKERVKDTKDVLFLSVDVPGCAPENTKLHVTGNQLTLYSERMPNIGDCDKKRTYKRAFQLPKEIVKPEGILACVVNGVFQAAVLPDAFSRPLKIDVNVTEDSQMWKEL